METSPDIVHRPFLTPLHRLLSLISFSNPRSFPFDYPFEPHVRGPLCFYPPSSAVTTCIDELDDVRDVLGYKYLLRCPPALAHQFSYDHRHPDRSPCLPFPIPRFFESYLPSCLPKTINDDVGSRTDLHGRTLDALNSAVSSQNSAELALLHLFKSYDFDLDDLRRLLLGLFSS